MGGDIKYTCSNGSWSKGSGSCKANCTASSFSNGYWKNNANNANVSGATLVHGTTISMVCSSGYTLVGSSVANCDNGSWNFSSSNGRCRKNGPVYFYYTGSSQTFNPSDYGLISGDVITLEVWGAQGGGSKGGKGGYSKGQYKYTGGSITVWVGGQGGNPGSNNNGGKAGWNNGGKAGIGCGEKKGTGGGGGGRTNIDLNGTPLIIAGGGGGATEDDYSSGGDGGGEKGGDGGGDYKGHGGSQNTAGVSSDECKGTDKGDGKNSSGGNGCSTTDHNRWCGGGGGGGYYGGGAGDWGKESAAGGGGGGSGHCNSTLVSGSCSMSSGQRNGNGKAEISW